MINELAPGGKPTRRNILHCEAIYQWGYFLYYTFQYFSNFYKLQLDKSDKKVVTNLYCLIGNLLATGSEKQAGRSDPAWALLLPSLDIYRRKVVSKLVSISIKPKGDQRQLSSEGLLKSAHGEG